MMCYVCGQETELVLVLTATVEGVQETVTFGALCKSPSCDLTVSEKVERWGWETTKRVAAAARQ